jgi:hypothetical protein
MRQARQCRCLNHIKTEGVECGVCWVGLKCTEQYGYKKPYRLRHCGIDTKIRPWCTCIRRWRYFCLVTVTQVTVLTQTAHSGLTIPMCQLTLTVVHKFLQGVPVGYKKQRLLTSIRHFTTEHFHALLFLKYTAVCGRDNWYYHQYLDIQDGGRSSLFGITV